MMSGPPLVGSVVLVVLLAMALVLVRRPGVAVGLLHHSLACGLIAVVLLCAILHFLLMDFSALVPPGLGGPTEEWLRLVGRLLGSPWPALGVVALLAGGPYLWWLDRLRHRTPATIARPRGPAGPLPEIHVALVGREHAGKSVLLGQVFRLLGERAMAPGLRLEVADPRCVAAWQRRRRDHLEALRTGRQLSTLSAQKLECLLRHDPRCCTCSPTPRACKGTPPVRRCTSSLKARLRSSASATCVSSGRSVRGNGSRVSSSTGGRCRRIQRSAGVCDWPTNKSATPAGRRSGRKASSRPSGLISSKASRSTTQRPRSRISAASASAKVRRSTTSRSTGPAGASRSSAISPARRRNDSVHVADGSSGRSVGRSSRALI